VCSTRRTVKFSNNLAASSRSLAEAKYAETIPSAVLLPVDRVRKRRPWTSSSRDGSQEISRMKSRGSSFFSSRTSSAEEVFYFVEHSAPVRRRFARQLGEALEQSALLVSQGGRDAHAHVHIVIAAAGTL
jgi:hypothetical protein